MLQTEQERFWFIMGLCVMGRINSFDIPTTNSINDVSSMNITSVECSNIERIDGRWVIKDE